MQKHGSKYFARRSTPTLGSKGQNSTFSEHGRVAYQIKGNHECSNIVANILPADTNPPPRPWGCGQKVKFQLFQNIAMLHIKLNGITIAEIWYQIFCLQTPSPIQRFQNMIMMHIRLKGIMNATTW